MDSADSIINSNFKEEKWIRMMKSILNKENGHQIENCKCIFEVPNSVKAIKPQAYTPQTIALGPHNSFHTKLYRTQNFKLYQAQILHQEFNLPDFQVLFDHIQRKVGYIRVHYQKHFDIQDETLSWMMVIDGLFLLRLIYKTGAQTKLVDSSGRRFPMDYILKDVVMIENQIPFFVLECLIVKARSYPLSENTSLLIITMMFCRRISPILLQGRFFKMDFESLHLLDILYNLVLVGGRLPDLEPATRRSSVWCDLWKRISAMNIVFLYIPKKIIELTVGFFQVLRITIPLQAVEEKALIPTASQLSSVKVKLYGINIGIRHINFKKEDATLSLPVLTLNANSEVIIRNLLAYEAMAEPETRNFARYIEVMAAMTETIGDVEQLKNKKIVRYDGDNGEVVKLFNGIKDCICDSNSEILDLVIKEINEYYDNTWKIKSKRLLKKYVYSSWKMLTILATILLLLMTSLQTFCSIYRCAGIFETNKSNLTLISSF